MNVTDTTNLITSSLTSYGGYILVILGSLVTLGIAYFIFKFGYKKIGSAFGQDVYMNTSGKFRYSKHKDI